MRTEVGEDLECCAHNSLSKYPITALRQPVSLDPPLLCLTCIYAITVINISGGSTVNGFMCESAFERREGKGRGVNNNGKDVVI